MASGYRTRPGGLCIESRREAEHYKRSLRRHRDIDSRRLGYEQQSEAIASTAGSHRFIDCNDDELRSRSHPGPWTRSERGRYRGRGGFGASVTMRSVSIRSLSLDDMMDLASLHPSDLVSRLSNNIKAFQHTLELPVTEPGIVGTLVDILLKVVQCLQDETAPVSQWRKAILILSEVLSERCSTFHLGLKQYIISGPKVSGPYLLPRTCYPSTLSLSQAQSLCSLFRALHTALPTSSGKCLPVDELAHALGQTSLFSSLDAEVQEIVKLHDEIKEAAIEKQQAQNSELVAGEEWDNEEFRKEPILPKWEEISRSDPPSRLRANIITGSYTDWNHYYDIHFRLLREDFIAPLRRGVCQFLEGARDSALKDLKVYHSVVIIEPVCMRSSIGYSIQFDVSHMQHCNWEHSERLRFGSLVCLSPDDFQDVIIFAVVSNREPKELKDGKLQIEIKEGKNIPYCKKATRFTMVESLQGYFEASKHTLYSLQTAEVDTMPFTQYIIKNKCDSVSLPMYLEASGVSTVYDLSFLCRNRDNDPADTQSSAHCPPKSCFDSSTLSGSLSTSSESMECVSDFETKGMIDILDPTKWAHLFEVDLDKSQLQAIQMALTQEIAVIQGPPGTGKTYIGLKIVEALLKNRKAWDPNEDSPILVMCLTNHALDQFLEGIIQNPNLDTQAEMCLSTKTKASIVRVGSRCQSEFVEKYSLYKKRQHVRVPEEFHRARKSKKQMRFNHRNEVLQTRFRYEKLMMAHSIVPLSELEVYINHNHLHQLQTTFEKQKQYALKLWLGLSRVKVLRLTRVKVQPLDSDHEMEDECVLPYKNQGYGVSMQPLPVLETTTSTQRQESHTTIEDSSRCRYYESENMEQSDEEGLSSAEFSEEEDSARMDSSDMNRYQQSDQSQQKHTFQQELDVQDEAWATELFQLGIEQPPMTKQEAQKVLDVNKLEQLDRWRLYNWWIAQLRFHLDQQINKDFMLYNSSCAEETEASQKCDRFTLETADIIGMTTTGAAKNQHILHLVKPKIVIVEEAAEVLESHVVSALNAGTQHLILIGDHKQLRPKPNEYNLAMKYKLDVSLFERLVRNGFPRATLQIQHRMRPQIARLVHPHIYDTLINHESVLKYEDVKGVVHNLFFIQHNHLEEVDTNLISHSNTHEARYLAALCKYLLQHGYKPTQITILVTYTGQLHTMRKELLKEDLPVVKLTTVDNFQGEENDIILLSFVRSNPEKSIGFLSKENRVCVALSRARMGLYCIGNFEMLRSKAQIWEKLISDMESRGHLGDALQLNCINHPDTKCAAKMPSDFLENAPNGGCTEDCDCRLDCGHVCVKKCHIKDPNHTAYQCRMPCPRKCPSGHQCRGLCFAYCKPCTVKVSKVIPNCGHKQEMPCCDDPSDKKCLHPKECTNGHACPEECWQKSCSPCKVVMKKVVPQCGHKRRMKCHVDPTTFKCLANCEQKCPNGHPCPKKCYRICGDCMQCSSAEDHT